MKAKQVLTIATELAYMMLKYGGEVYRAEQSARYICNFYGITDVDVFAIPTSIVITITEDENFHTKTRRITSNEVDLAKVVELNSLSRYIGQHRPEYSEVMQRLRAIDEIEPHATALRVLAGGMVALSFAVIFNATAVEAVIAFFIGLVSGVQLIFMKHQNMNNFLSNTFCSATISFFAFSAAYFGGDAVNTQSIIAGSLMILVPGLALTNCMRDFMANDYMAGVAKFTEATMTAVATALGVAIVMILFSVL